jgi:hypothetical protein
VRLAFALAAALLVPASAALAASGSSPYPTHCAVELSRPLAGTGAGPICGTDEGDDVFFTGEAAAVQFFGENGHDTVAGSVFGDRLIGGGGNDELHGDRGDDVIDGGDDSDVLFGGPGNDTLRERRFGFDTLYAGPGDDVLAGGRENDLLYGGTGNDVLYGGSGRGHGLELARAPRLVHSEGCGLRAHPRQRPDRALPAARPRWR